MKEITVKVADNTFEEIKKQLLYVGNTKNITLNITEALIKESSPIDIEYLKGELM